MPDLDHTALEAAARKFDAAGQLNMFVGTSVVLALLEERKRLAERVRNLAEGRDMMGNKWAEALDRATAAEAELAALKAERDEALCPSGRRRSNGRHA